MNGSMGVFVGKQGWGRSAGSGETGRSRPCGKVMDETADMGAGGKGCNFGLGNSLGDVVADVDVVENVGGIVVNDKAEDDDDGGDGGEYDGAVGDDDDGLADVCDARSDDKDSCD